MKRTGCSVVDISRDWAFAWSETPQAVGSTTRLALEREGLEFKPCRVPGNFELDLLALGEIPDPYFGLNMLEVRRFEEAHIWYATRFARPESVGGRVVLCFEGVDCFGSVYLNGELIGQCENMLVEHRFDVTDLLEGENELLVYLAPPTEGESGRDYPDYVAAGPGQMESLYVRKAPHMYGWDIMPRALSRGLWRPVKLEILPDVRIEEAFLETASLSPERDLARLRLHYRISEEGSYTLRIGGVCGASAFGAEEKVASAAGTIDIELKGPELWWPRDAGAAALYKVEVTLLKGEEPVDELKFRHGVRTIELDRAKFALKVNGEPIFVRGTNWVALDAFHSRDMERLPRALELLWDSGCNLVRCWGGNIYESDEFFDYCDSRGIMVWQDFAMACMLYPMDEEFQKKLADEAPKVIRRLREHACLVLWAGDNECDISRAQGWHTEPRDPGENVLTRKLLPELVQVHDGSRPYLPSSPYLSPGFVKDEETCIPEDHLWGPRGYYKAPYYAEAACNFVSEIGYHGCPSPESIRQFISEVHLWPYQDNPEWQLHATDAIPGVTAHAGRNDLMTNQVKLLFGEVPDTLERFSQASQIVQAEAMKHFVERFRYGKWQRTGIIWWNLLDGWPQFSDAVVDYYFRTKLAYRYIRRVQSPICLMLDEAEGGRQRLFGVNDYLTSEQVSYRLWDLDTEVTLAEGRAELPANSSTAIAEVSTAVDGPRFIVFDWQCRGEDRRSHYLLGEPPFDLEQYLSWVRRAGIDSF